MGSCAFLCFCVVFMLLIFPSVPCVPHSHFAPHFAGRTKNVQIYKKKSTFANIFPFFSSIPYFFIIHFTNLHFSTRATHAPRSVSARYKIFLAVTPDTIRHRLANLLFFSYFQENHIFFTKNLQISFFFCNFALAMKIAIVRPQTLNGVT